MFSEINRIGHPMPNHPGDGNHRPDHPEKPDEPVSVIVNGVDKVLPAGTKQLSYEGVVKLAYGSYNSSSSVIYSVAYSNGPVENKKGVLVKGDSVRIRKGMIFNVGCSNKS